MLRSLALEAELASHGAHLGHDDGVRAAGDARPDVVNPRRDERWIGVRIVQLRVEERNCDVALGSHLPTKRVKLGAHEPHHGIRGRRDVLVDDPAAAEIERVAEVRSAVGIGFDVDRSNRSLTELINRREVTAGAKQVVPRRRLHRLDAVTLRPRQRRHVRGVEAHVPATRAAFRTKRRVQRVRRELFASPSQVIPSGDLNLANLRLRPRGELVDVNGLLRRGTSLTVPPGQVERVECAGVVD